MPKEKNSIPRCEYAHEEVGRLSQKIKEMEKEHGSSAKEMDELRCRVARLEMTPEELAGRKESSGREFSAAQRFENENRKKRLPGVRDRAKRVAVANWIVRVIALVVLTGYAYQAYTAPNEVVLATFMVVFSVCMVSMFSMNSLDSMAKRRVRRMESDLFSDAHQFYNSQSITPEVRRVVVPDGLKNAGRTDKYQVANGSHISSEQAHLSSKMPNIKIDETKA